MTSTVSATSAPPLPPAASTSSVTRIDPSPSDTSVKSNKRKFDDAIHSLDDAITSHPEHADGARAPKRQHTVRSLYSSLAKYGIKSRRAESTSTLPAAKPADLSKTPHLAAILSRTATKTRNAIPMRLRSSTPGAFANTDYRPSSTPSFLARLATFKLNTYSNKPSAIDAVAAAKCGWVNDGKDRLMCGICNASWVLAGREGMSRDAANALVEKQRAQLVEQHKGGCPWKTRQCDADVYRITLSSPAGMAKEIKVRALALDPVLEGVEVKHPLTATQTHNLFATIASIQLDSSASSDAETVGEEGRYSTESRPAPEPSQTAILTALFGWSIAPPPPPPQPSRPLTPSLSRAASRASSVAPSLPATPTRPSRISFGRDGTPTPSTPRHSTSGVDLQLMRSPTPSVSGDLKRDTTLLHCPLCHRRVGLWAVGASSSRMSTSSLSESAAAAVPARQIDLLKEHRPYCPYVERTAVVPSLPVPPTHGRSNSSTPSLPSMFSPSNGTLPGLPGAIEGWRAVLTVVLRYRMGQKQRDGLLREVAERMENAREGIPSPALGRTVTWAEGDQMDLDPVEAMVAGVKSKGGRDLLKYVKGLLGSAN